MNGHPIRSYAREASWFFEGPPKSAGHRPAGLKWARNSELHTVLYKIHPREDEVFTRVYFSTKLYVKRKVFPVNFGPYKSSCNQAEGLITWAWSLIFVGRSKLVSSIWAWSLILSLVVHAREISFLFFGVRAWWPSAIMQLAFGQTKSGLRPDLDSLRSKQFPNLESGPLSETWIFALVRSLNF